MAPTPTPIDIKALRACTTVEAVGYPRAWKCPIVAVAFRSRGIGQLDAPRTCCKGPLQDKEMVECLELNQW